MTEAEDVGPLVDQEAEAAHAVGLEAGLGIASGATARVLQGALHVETHDPAPRQSMETAECPDER